MRNRTPVLLTALLLAIAALPACQVEQTSEGEPPSVDVDPGTAPEFDVDPARVEVGTDTETVVVPDVDVVPADSPAVRR